MTRIEEWRENDDTFSDLAQNAVNAIETGDMTDALLNVRAMRGMFRLQLSNALNVDTVAQTVGILMPQRKGWH